jgi:Flp pilus assembly protein TadG
MSRRRWWRSVVWCDDAGPSHAGRDDAGHADAGCADAGSAIIEFVFVAVIVMVPLVYLIVAVAAVQRSQLAVSQAAREAGRAFATSGNPAQAQVRVAAAVRLALAAQHLPNDADVRYVAAGAGCSAPAITPGLTPGAQFTVCVTRHTQVPGVPSVLAGRGITSVGEYTVHIDDYRVTS